MIAQGLVAYLSGLLFAAGLALASMTSPDKILRFLDVTHWDPSLMLVMAGALAVFAAGFRLVTQRAKPLLAPRFELPTRSQVDRTLVIGAVLFGIGWALGGLCGGPAIASLFTGRVDVLVFLAGMLLGMLPIVLRAADALIGTGTRSSTTAPQASSQRTGTNMTQQDRKWVMQLTCVHEGSKNTPGSLAVTQLGTDGTWTPLTIDVGSPGFLIFVYSIFTCQHLYMYVNAAERGLLLGTCAGRLELTAGTDWMLKDLRVKFDVDLKSGTPAPGDVADIENRMNKCPVSRNLQFSGVHESTLTLKPVSA